MIKGYQKPAKLGPNGIRGLTRKGSSPSDSDNPSPKRIKESGVHKMKSDKFNGKAKYRFDRERRILEAKIPRMGDGSDVDVTETGNALPSGVPIRRKIVLKKTKGFKLRQQNADRYKGYEERIQKQQHDHFGFSDGEGHGSRRPRFDGNDSYGRGGLERGRGFNFK